MLIPRVPPQHRAFLAEGRLAGPMPWVIAVLMFLTLLAAAGGVVLASASASLGSEIAGRATIQIVEPVAARQSELVRAVQGAVRAQPYVRAARTVPREETEAMLGQWFGTSAGGGDSAAAMLGDIPLPALIDVDFVSGDARAGAQRLRAALAPVAPQARIVPHADWLGPVATMIRSLSIVAAVLVVLMTLATVAIVMLAARSALSAQRATIDILHLIGATDMQITRLFQRRIAIDTAYGVALGTMAAVAVMLLLGWQFRGVTAGLATGASLGWVGLALLLALPLLGIAVAALTARWTLLRALSTAL